MAITIYKALNFSENLLAGWDWADFIYLKENFLLTTLYARKLEVIMLPEEGIALRNHINNKLRLRLKSNK